MTSSIFELGLHFDLYTPVNFSVCILTLLHHLKLSTGRNINNNELQEKKTFLVGRSCLTESQGENDASFAIMGWRQRQLRVGYKPGLSGVKKKKHFY